MKFQNFTYRTQIFLSSLLLIIPSIILGIITANQNANLLTAEYNESLNAILSQTDLTLDTLLSDATKIADLHILNNDIRKAMLTDYSDDLLSYAQDNTMITKQLSQTNRLNSNVMSCVYKNKYNFTFEYNILNETERDIILQNMTNWSSLARSSNYYTYFGSPYKYPSSNNYILPMIKILYDSHTFKEIGICYVGINFSSVEKIFCSSKITDNIIFIYDSSDNLIYSSNNTFIKNPKNSELINAINLSPHSSASTLQHYSSVISSCNNSYVVNSCHNRTTGWRIVQIVNNHTITQAYKNNLISYSGIFLFTLILELFLAFFLSRNLTRSIQLLCKKIDSKQPGDNEDITVDSWTSNVELQKLVTSYNHLNKRLSESLKRNYSIRLNEQAMKIKMLQTQINHHFLYNTLNSIKCLADLHNESEIKTIAVCMSELLRYNLKKIPIVHLKEELQQVNRYLTILNIRFPNKFILDCNISDIFYDLEIPAFILQPLIENSVEHGFDTKETDCYISISTHLDENSLHFFVVDNGVGIHPERLKMLRQSLECNQIYSTSENHHFIGLMNVHQRIQSYYGKKYGLTIESFPDNGTIIDISIPYDVKPTIPEV